jgi:hypothetical protein
MGGTMSSDPVKADPQAKVQHLQVFLCHSSGDKEVVRQINDRLLRLGGVDPWLDEKKLIPGQDWDLKIRQAVRSAHVVLVCLSTRSVSKEGYVQREIRQSLDMADEKPDGTIFIIPLRLEECEVPVRLQRWQWVDWFSSEGFERLQKALQIRAESLSIDISALPAKLVYDSRQEQPAFSSWTIFSTAGNFRGIYQKSSAEIDKYIVIESFGSEFVGINRTFRYLAGAFEFDYKVQCGSPAKQNLLFYAIPMQENGISRTGLIEVGTDIQDDPRNPDSPYRVKFFVPQEHMSDGAWHHARLDFNFQDLPDAFYSVFAPRVNEGCANVGPAALAIANVQLYVSS